jgi:hypothetical protein
MRETILPTSPSTRIVLWAMLNAFWFRVVPRTIARAGDALLAFLFGEELAHMARMARSARQVGGDGDGHPVSGSY